MPSHSATSAPPTLRVASISVPSSARWPTLPRPVVWIGVTVTPGSVAETRTTTVPESVTAGTRKASATGPNPTWVRVPVIR